MPRIIYTADEVKLLLLHTAKMNGSISQSDEVTADDVQIVIENNTLLSVEIPHKAFVRMQNPFGDLFGGPPTGPIKR